MAEELLLGSSRVVPGALEAAGFVFKHPDVATYLEKHQFR
jgi:NAD dependent epimerase/dehydratase family enzyme